MGHKLSDISPVTSFEIIANEGAAGILKRMTDTGFQGRNLGRMVRIWLEMIKKADFIFLGLAGAMVPAGMKKCIAYLIEKRWIDCLVSTGANLFHDIHEGTGRHHYQGEPSWDDLELKEHGLDRIYDVLASEQEFRQTDDFIADFTDSLSWDRPYTTCEYFNLLGRKLTEMNTETGILRSAYETGVPIYCPAIGDSSIGIAIASRVEKTGRTFTFDVIGDILETAKMVTDRTTGVVYIGGGTPKNFIQQTEVTASVLGHETEGHAFALQITQDVPYWGGLSGCTFEEAQSWGKIACSARKLTLYSDATIALPLIVSALAAERNEEPRGSAPQFTFGRHLKVENKP